MNINHRSFITSTNRIHSEVKFWNWNMLCNSYLWTVTTWWWLAQLKLYPVALVVTSELCSDSEEWGGGCLLRERGVDPAVDATTLITTTTTPALHRKSFWTPIEISALKTFFQYLYLKLEIVYTLTVHTSLTHELLNMYVFYQTPCVFIRNILMISSHVSWHWHHTYSDLCPLISVTGVSAGLRSADGNISYQQLLSTLSLLFITQTTVC